MGEWRNLKTLEPLLGEENLSKSSISRVVQRIKGVFAAWSGRDLTGERYGVLYLDGLHLKVRLVRRVVTVPILVALGVRDDGSKELLALRLAAVESWATWGVGGGSVPARDAGAGLGRERRPCGG